MGGGGRARDAGRSALDKDELERLESSVISTGFSPALDLGSEDGGSGSDG
jgi:hypothetical protein